VLLHLTKAQVSVPSGMKVHTGSGAPPKFYSMGTKVL